MRDEENPVMDHVKRAIIRAEMREEAPTASDRVSDTAPSMEATGSVPSDANPQETIAATNAQVLSPELTTITRAAEVSAKRQSNTRREDVDFFERVMKPLESRDVLAPVRRDVIAPQSSYEPVCDFDPIRQEVATPSLEPVESGYLAEWNWVPKKW